MMRIEGVPVVAERLQKALRSACQTVPCHGTTTTDTSARDEFQSGLDMDPGAFVQGSIDTARCLRRRIA